MAVVKTKFLTLADMPSCKAVGHKPHDKRYVAVTHPKYL